MITVLIGISGSGKTSFSNSTANRDTISISRDKTRKMLFDADQNDISYFEREDLKKCELLVTETIDDLIYNSLQKEIDIILDNTHLEKRFIDDILFKFNHLSPIELIFFECTLVKAKQRVMERNGWENKAYTNYMDRQYSQYETLKKEMHGERLFYPQTSPQVKFDSNLPPAYVFDIDGTLALKGDRDIYDDSMLHLDTEIEQVGTILRALDEQRFHIIFVTGRGEECRESTTKWLLDNNLWTKRSEMFMRPAVDQRNDAVIKEEIVVNNLVPNYNVKAVIDDRLGVTRNFHKLGIFVLNVNQNFIKF